jgi:hypothetical protein
MARWKSPPQIWDWTAILKAGTVDEEEEVLPSRYEDPFRKPSRDSHRRSRTRLPPVRQRYIAPRPGILAPVRVEHIAQAPVHRQPIAYADDVDQVNAKRIGVVSKT